MAGTFYLTLSFKECKDGGKRLPMDKIIINICYYFTMEGKKKIYDYVDIKRRNGQRNTERKWENYQTGEGAFPQ